MRSVFYFAAAAAIVAGMNCTESKPPLEPDAPLKTVLISDGFENDSAVTANWMRYYLAQDPPRYAWLTVTAAEKHSGAKSLTSDSSHCGITRQIEKIDTGLIGMEFYLMAGAPSQAKFGATFGESGGSSSMPLHSYGFAFDSTDSIKTIDFDFFDTTRAGINLDRIQPGHWYKCVVEIDFKTTNNITYYLDDALVNTVSIPSSAASTLSGIDVMEVVRASIPAGGAKPCYLDDFCLYTK